MAGSVLSVQRMAGNRAVAQLMGRSVDTEVPAGVSSAAGGLPAGATASSPGSATVVSHTELPGGWTEAGGKVSSGRVGSVDRILLEGLSGSQGGKDGGWGAGAKARNGHVAATGGGGAGHRGRAVALVPQGMKRSGGPISVVVHLHGIDAAIGPGTSGMRETGAAPEDVRDFQIPQQLEAFAGQHPDARMVVLMPLGATVKAGGGYTVDFGIGSLDTFVEESLGKLGIAADGTPPGTVYLSAHSGGGFAVSAWGSEPLKRYRFGGVFAFESFHGDLDAWEKIVTDHLGKDHRRLRKLREDGGDEGKIAAAQAEYLRTEGFRFVAFGGSTPGYAARARALRETILKWFRDNHDALAATTGGHSELIGLLWRNYQAGYADEKHMESLSKGSHFESALEMTLATPPASASATAAGSATGAGPAMAPPTGAPTKHRHHAAHAAKTPTAPSGSVDHKQQAREEHKGEPTPSKPTATAPVKAADAAPAKHAAAGRRRKSLQDPFVFSKWPLYDKPITLIHKGKGSPHKRDVAGTPSEFMPDLLQRANVPSPENFFNEFVADLEFLGKPINAPIHKHLAEHLRTVEREFAFNFGGPDKDPKVAGQVLGLDEDIAGARGISATSAISMHMFGLAIDVNHHDNPYLQAGGGIPNKIFERIGELMKGEALMKTYTPKRKKGAKKDPQPVTVESKTDFEGGDQFEDTRRKYTRMKDFNQLVVDYFALVDPAHDAELKSRLQTAIGPWKGVDADTARQTIEADVMALAIRLGRPPKKKDKHDTKYSDLSDVEVIRRKGFLQLREEVVLGLKLNWGAWYGDMMHFDMRSDGDIGQRISEQIFRFLGEQKAIADAPDPLR